MDNPHIEPALDHLPVIDFSITRQTVRSAILAERMAFYKVPGVSVAVIDDLVIDWEREEGRLRAKAPLRYLLSGHSGLPAQAQLDDRASILEILRGDKPATSPAAVPRSEPGTRWDYPNPGYVVTRQLLEDVLRRRFDELAAEVIFEPLGMMSSTFSYPLPDDLRHREAMPHATDGSPEAPQQSGQAGTPGGLLRTPHDMATLVFEVTSAFLGKPDRVISQDTARLMMTKQVDVPTDALGGSLGMGSGIFIDSGAREPSFLHPGHSSSGTTFLVFAYPDLGKGAVTAANGNLGDRLYLELLAAIAIEYGWPGGQPFKQ